MNNRIKELRENKNLTQSQLAQVCHISQQQISKIECKNSDPSVELAFTIAQALGCSIDELFTGEQKRG